jgi:protein-S-isoprenylcysteine O-methyltransferase Ste14
MTPPYSVIVLAVLPAAGLLVRIRSEERALLEALGDDYRRYAATIGASSRVSGNWWPWPSA